jgi:hypothetical protein
MGAVAFHAVFSKFVWVERFCALIMGAALNTTKLISNNTVHWKLSFLVLSIVSIDVPIMPVQLASR